MSPNRPRPGNPARAVRVENELWDAAKAIAEQRGEDVSKVIRRALERYVKRYAKESRQPFWEAVRSAPDRRRVHYWRLTTDSDRRSASLGAVAPQGENDEGGAGFRARTYDWSTGNPGGSKLGIFPTKREAMSAVELATYDRAHLFIDPP